jgi:hypothetical protein
MVGKRIGTKAVKRQIEEYKLKIKIDQNQSKNDILRHNRM